MPKLLRARGEGYIGAAFCSCLSYRQDEGESNVKVEHALPTATHVLEQWHASFQISQSWMLMSDELAASFQALADMLQIVP